MIDLISSKEFSELLTDSLLKSKYEMTVFQDQLKKQYKKAWGSSEWLDSRLAKEYTKFIVNHMLNKLQGYDEEGRDSGSDRGSDSGI